MNVLSMSDSFKSIQMYSKWEYFLWESRVSSTKLNQHQGSRSAAAEGGAPLAALFALLRCCSNNFVSFAHQSEMFSSSLPPSELLSQEPTMNGIG